MRVIKVYLNILKHLLKRIRKKEKLLSIFLVVSCVMIALLFVFRADTEKKIYDGLFSLTKNYQNDLMKTVIISFILFIIIYIVHQIIIYLSNLSDEILTLRLQKIMSDDLCMRTSRLSAENFEDPNFLDKLEKASQGKNDAIIVLLNSIALITYYIPYTIFMSFWLWEQSKLLVIIIIISFIPTIIAYIVQVKLLSENEDSVAPLRRKATNYNESIIGKVQNKDTRISGGFKFFIKKYKDTVELIANNDLKVYSKQRNINISMNVLQSLSLISIFLISIYLTYKGEISIGSFAAIFSSVDTMYSNIDEAVNSQFAGISESFATVRNYFEFISCKDFEKYQNAQKEVTGLENIYFKYPNTDSYILKNINLNIKEGEKIAIVGENGSGKSTLAKILLGVYKPTEGKITYSDKSSVLNTVPQDFVKYSMSIKDNVIISHSNKVINDEGLCKILDKTGLNVDSDKYNSGLDTMLGKEFSGIELSGGEWQKLTIARAINKKSDFIVFDEPTSAIDPIEETNIINLINEIAKNQTSIIITHRMATTKNADKIIVLKNGSIVEEGTHEGLLSLKQEYCRLYQSQKSNYSME